MPRSGDESKQWAPSEFSSAVRASLRHTVGVDLRDGSKRSSPLERWPLFAKVEFLPNDLGVNPGSIGYILEDYGSAYEVEASAPDGSTLWIGGVDDRYLVLSLP